jgi:hypothetical protein
LEIEVTVARARNFPADELLKFQINSGQSRYLTNSGKVFVCTFDGTALEIGEPSGSAERPYLTLLSAKDENGNSRVSRAGMRMSAGRIRGQQWRIGQPALSMSAELAKRYGVAEMPGQTGPTPKSLDVELAFPKVVKTEFFVKLK